MSASIARAPQMVLKGPWGRAAKTQMVRGKMVPSARPYKPRSNEATFVVFPVRWPEGGFFRTQIYVSEVENDLDTTGWRGGAEKIAKKGGSRRPKTYTENLRYTIP
jgi:hypothetical protein